MKNLKLKHYLALILALSGIFAICFESFTKGFVTYVPYGGGEFVYLKCKAQMKPKAYCYGSAES